MMKLSLSRLKSIDVKGVNAYKLSMRCYVVECCDRIIPASRAVEIATNALASEYRFVDPERLTIGVVNVKYEGCVWNVRLQVVIDDKPVQLMSTHLIQVDACTGQVVGHVLEDHILLR